jgi:putative ABC transport system permease protein
MLAHYLAVAVRALQRDPGHVAVNVAGLAVALAASLLIALYVKHELSFESFISEPGRVYRVEAEMRAPGQAPHLSEGTPFAVSGLLAADFEDQLVATRLTSVEGVLEAAGSRRRLTVNVVDPNFFDVLDFPVAEGDIAAAMREPGAVALSERMATRLFGASPAIGETVRFDEQHDLRVAAILEDPPKNSRFELDVLASLATPALAPAPDLESNWTNWGQETFVRLRGATTADTLAAQLPGLVARHRPEPEDGSEIRLSLRPLRAIHLFEEPDGTISDRNAVAVLALSSTAAFLVFIACFSYVNLATARSLQRASEIGLRKILGGRATHLAAQFLAESFAITLLAFGLAIALAAGGLPAFARLVGRPLGIEDAMTPGFAAVAAALLVAASLAAGAYPALVLASRKPMELFYKRPGSAAATGVLRTGIVALQFGLTTAVMIAAIVAYAQLRHLRSIDLGFDARGLLVIALSPENMQDGADLVFRDALARSPSIENATARSFSPSATYGLFAEAMQWDGRAASEPILGAFAGDTRFFDVYGLSPIAGRVFADDRGDDPIRLPSAEQPVVQSSMVLSEAAARAYGFSSPEAAIDKVLTWPVFGGSVEFTVVGVTPDAHLRLARQPMLPTAYALNDPNAAFQFFPFPEVAARVQDGAAQAALDDAARIWSEHFPDTPFSYEFLDDRIAAANAEDDQLSKLLAVFAGLSLAVACLGLFALASFVAAQRTHEIAVRKVLGASVARVSRLLMWDFAKPVLLANVVAWPLAYAATRAWLDRFAYRIDLSPTLFLAVSALALALALITVFARTLRAASVAPALVLKSE